MVCLVLLLKIVNHLIFFNFFLASSKLELVSSQFDRPNGIGVTPDGKKLIVGITGKVDPHWHMFDINPDGSVNTGSGIRFLDGDLTNPLPGGPDGLTIDSNGNLFLSHYGIIYDYICIYIYIYIHIYIYIIHIYKYLYIY